MGRKTPRLHKKRHYQGRLYGGRQHRALKGRGSYTRKGKAPYGASQGS